MRILITGSRSYNNKYKVLDTLINVIRPGDVLVHGGASGPDSHAEEWAQKNSIRTEVYRPLGSEGKWYLYRNAEMVGACDKVLAFWDGESTGTAFTIQYAQKRGKPVTVIQ